MYRLWCHYFLRPTTMGTAISLYDAVQVLQRGGEAQGRLFVGSVQTPDVLYDGLEHLHALLFAGSPEHSPMIPRRDSPFPLTQWAFSIIKYVYLYFYYIQATQNLVLCLLSSPPSALPRSLLKTYLFTLKHPFKARSRLLLLFPGFHLSLCFLSCLLRA